jgi:hypothetical protein
VSKIEQIKFVIPRTMSERPTIPSLRFPSDGSVTFWGAVTLRLRPLFYWPNAACASQLMGRKLIGVCMPENPKSDDVSVICEECSVRAKVAQRSLRSEQIWPSIAPACKHQPVLTCPALRRAFSRAQTQAWSHPSR